MMRLRIVLREVLSDKALDMGYVDGGGLELDTVIPETTESVDLSGLVSTGVLRAQDEVIEVALRWPKMGLTTTPLTHTPERLTLDLRRGSLTGPVLECLEVPDTKRPTVDDVWYLVPISGAHRFPFQITQAEILDD